MRRGTVLFAALFVLLPALLFVGAVMLPPWSVLLGVIAIVLLLFGFTLGIPMAEA